MRSRILLLLATAAASTTPALAQSRDDVVVMRRAIAPRQAPAPSAGVWTYTDWTYVGAETCTDSAEQTRTASCVENGRPANPGRCSGEPDEVSRRVGRYDGCSFDWNESGFGEYSTRCGLADERVQTVTCVRFGGDSIPYTMPADEEDRCLATRPRPASVSPADEVTTDCTYTPAYGACQPATGRADGANGEQRIISCTRSDGKASALSACGSDKQTKPCTITYTATQGTTWSACVRTTAGSSQGTQSLPIDRCTRSTDGASVSTAYCESQRQTRSCVVPAGTCGTMQSGKYVSATQGKIVEKYVYGATAAAQMANSKTECEGAVPPSGFPFLLACYMYARPGGGGDLRIVYGRTTTASVTIASISDPNFNVATCTATP